MAPGIDLRKEHVDSLHWRSTHRSSTARDVVHYTSQSPWPAVSGCVQPLFQPLHTETCCLPWLHSCETKESPMWPKHDVTGMCASEFKTRPLSSWHLFTVIITPPRLSSVTLDAGAASPWPCFLASPDWRIQLCFLWVCGGSRRAGLPNWVSRVLHGLVLPFFVVSCLFGPFYSPAVREKILVIEADPYKNIATKSSPPLQIMMK